MTNYPMLNEEERNWLAYLQALPSGSMTPEYEKYYAYLCKKIRTPPPMAKAAKTKTKPQAAQKVANNGAKSKTSDWQVGVVIVGFVIIFLAAREMYLELKKPLPVEKTQKVTYSKRRT